MKYFYLSAEGTTAGPETLETLTAMVARGEITLGTLVVPAGGEDWTPLARVLRFFYADAAGATAGPVAFSEINRLHQIAALPAEAWIMEEGATEWKSVASVLTNAGVPVVAPPAPAAHATARTPPYRPPQTVRAGHSHAADHYAPPKSHGRTTAVRYRATGGIGRMQYILFSVLLNVLLAGVIFAIGVNMLGSRELSVDQMNLLWERNMAALSIVVFIAFVGGLVLSLLRQQNIGWPWFFILFSLVPFVNVWFAIALLAYPPGYARHKRFDTAAKAIAAAVVGLVIAGIVLMMVFGKRGDATPGKSDKPAPAGAA
jgi:hypothetical protein